MQIHSFQIKSYRWLLCLTILCYIPVQAQNSPVDNYFHQVGDYADIYNGRLETGYNTLLYENVPYYRNADYTEASIVYRDNYYPNQKVRLDLFKEQLILLAPEKLYGIILNSQNVEKVYMYNKTFVWLVPPKESGLKDGYYMQLSEGKEMQLFCKEIFTLQSRKEALYSKKFDYFELKIRHYLIYNDRFYPVKNKASFSRIFPRHKKQINKFSRDNKLKFKQDKEKSLTSLTEYCEVLLKQDIQ